MKNESKLEKQEINITEEPSLKITFIMLTFTTLSIASFIFNCQNLSFNFKDL